MTTYKIAVHEQVEVIDSSSSDLTQLLNRIGQLAIVFSDAKRKTESLGFERPSMMSSIRVERGLLCELCVYADDVLLHDKEKDENYIVFRNVIVKSK